MLMDEANALADKLRDSEEYRTYCETKARAYENPSTAALLDEFFSLRKRLQTSAMTGETDELAERKLQKMGELLQFDRDAAEFLMAEYRLNDLLSGIYKVLAAAIGFDLDV
jgi:cell fate (sporulation/competence/biofilm development) regulator YlbF (YheA/YmcA/DUF963 family)